MSDGPKMRLQVRKLGLGNFTEDGAFYACVDGKPIGENGRAFWPTRPEAVRVGMRFLTKLLEYEAQAA